MIHSLNDCSFTQEEKTMLELMARARRDELAAASVQIEHRIAWDQISRVLRLERALKAARARLFVEPQITAGAH
jgi:hypothetical protein